MLSLATWKNPKEKGEIKGHTCACIIPEEKLKKTVTNLKRNKSNYDKFKNTRQYDVENLELIKHPLHTFETLIIGLIYPT